MVKNLLIFSIFTALCGGAAALLYFSNTDTATDENMNMAAFGKMPSDSLAIEDSLNTSLKKIDSLTEAYLTNPTTGEEIHLQLINKTFLGNDARNLAAYSAMPDSLQIHWQHYLGSGTTYVGGEKVWSGAGWTGQPLIVEENGEAFLIQGAYDHRLKKIRLSDAQLIWEHEFSDVIKGTGTIWINHKARNFEESVIIMQGSRASGQSKNPVVDSYRGISYFTGKQLWQINSVRTASYSRDVDASSLVYKDTGYIGLENGIFMVFNPDPAYAQMLDGVLQPQIYKNTDTLFVESDRKLHGGNLVTESSPTRIKDHIFIASGSGWLWGFNTKTQSIDWSFFIGSDIDGSPIVTNDHCLLIAVEKQYIQGRGGLLKINPFADSSQNPIEWYFPTENKIFASWEGGIIGSAGTNENFIDKKAQKALAAFTAIDGNTYVVDINKISSQKGLIFDNKTEAFLPELIFQYKTGPAITTPIFSGNRLLCLTYDGMFLFEHDENYTFKLLKKIDIRGEATPVVYKDKIYVASRDGFLYCLGTRALDEKPFVVRPSRKTEKKEAIAASKPAVKKDTTVQTAAAENNDNTQ